MENTDLIKQFIKGDEKAFDLLVKNNKILYQHTGYRNGDEYELFEILKKVSKE